MNSTPGFSGLLSRNSRAEECVGSTVVILGELAQPVDHRQLIY